MQGEKDLEFRIGAQPSKEHVLGYSGVRLCGNSAGACNTRGRPDSGCPLAWVGCNHLLQFLSYRTSRVWGVMSGTYWNSNSLTGNSAGTGHGVRRHWKS